MITTPDGRRLYATPYQHRKRAKQRRALRRARGWCVNHDDRIATHGVRCAECHETHRRSA
jgi:hypothetical protein